VNDPSLDNSAIMGSITKAEVTAAFDYAAQILMNIFSDPINVTVTLAASSNPSIFGQSSSFLFGTSYTNLRNAFLADATTTDDTTAYAADVPPTDPTVNGNWFVTKAQAKALKIIPNDDTPDGTFTFGTTSGPFTFDPNNRAVGGKFDFIGVVLHEVTEIMGRIYGLNQSTSIQYLAYDLFRYRGTGVRGITNIGAGNYFSINAGVTNLRGYNDRLTNGGDPQDWDNAVIDSCNAFLGPGVQANFTVVDEQAMDVIGYDRRPGFTLPGVQPNAYIGGGTFAGVSVTAGVDAQ